MNSIIKWAPVACTSLVLTACLSGGAAPGAANGGAVAAAVPTIPDKKCPAEFTIDDVEDNNNQLLSQKGRAGYWYTFLDKVGSTITPTGGGRFTMAQGGANGSGFAARMSGKLSPSGDPIFAGMGFSFTEPKAPYNASAYTGISFYAKVGPDSIGSVRLKVPDVNTDPAGGQCTQCYNDFGQDFTFTKEWTKYTVAFASLRQLDGWGAPHPAAIDTSKLFGLQWQVVTAGSSFDVYVDDIQFTGCP